MAATLRGRWAWSWTSQDVAPDALAIALRLALRAGLSRMILWASRGIFFANAVSRRVHAAVSTLRFTRAARWDLSHARSFLWSQA